MFRRAGFLFALILSLPCVSLAAENSSPEWNSLVDQYLEQILFRFGPSGGTSAGLHQYDAQLEDFSRRAVDSQIAALKTFEKRASDFPPSSLSQTEAADRDMLLGSIRSNLLSLQVIKPWQKDPNFYTSTATNSVYVIMNRRFAPPDDRLRSVIAREQKIPGLFVAAHENLQNPPHIYTEIAIEQLPGIISFFEKDLPSAFPDTADASVKSEFTKSNAAVIAELKKFQ